MEHPFSNMTNEQLLEHLVEYLPASGKVAMRKEFAEAIHRYRRVFDAIPYGGGQTSLLDIGSRLYTASLYCNELDYFRVSLATKWKTTFTGDDILATIPNSERIDISYFDAEKDAFPYADASYDVVVCSEIIEHLAIDPMHMLAEINRVARPGATLVLTTPNAASFSAVKRLLADQHPYSWSPYNGTSTDRHNREYTIKELERVVSAAGFSVETSETISRVSFASKDRLLATWISLPDILRRKAGLDLDQLGDTSVVVGKKESPVRERFPAWLYYDAKKGR